MITVTAAVIERAGRVLICQRRADQKHPLKWEFPGGKVEAGEDPEAGLRRELQEELGIEAAKIKEITRFEFQYPGGDPFRLIFYQVEQYEGVVQNQVFADIRWAEVQQLPDFDFLEGDIEFVHRLATGTDWRRAG